jgi:hypothetical protein
MFEAPWRRDDHVAPPLERKKSPVAASRIFPIDF